MSWWASLIKSTSNDVLVLELAFIRKQKRVFVVKALKMLVQSSRNMPLSCERSYSNEVMKYRLGIVHHRFQTGNGLLIGTELLLAEFTIKSIIWYYEKEGLWVRFLYNPPELDSITSFVFLPPVVKSRRGRNRITGGKSHLLLVSRKLFFQNHSKYLKPSWVFTLYTAQVWSLVNPKNHLHKFSLAFPVMNFKFSLSDVAPKFSK